MEYGRMKVTAILVHPDGTRGHVELDEEQVRRLLDDGA